MPTAQPSPHKGNPLVRRASPTPMALALVAGAALQLHQVALWPWMAYGVLALAGVWAVGYAAVRARRQWGSSASQWQRHGAQLLVCAALCALGFAAAGLQGSVRDRQRIDSALEGVDLQITARIDAMPHRSAQGVRMRVHVEHAQRGAQTVVLPERIELTWYAPRAAAPSAAAAGEVGDGDTAAAQGPPAVRAGERWRWSVRLKAPHGARNPYGWDWELWLWAQGIGATGYVRDGPSQMAPQQLAPAGWYRPVEQLRQHVRDAIAARGARASTPRAVDRAVQLGAAMQAQQLRAYGVVAALVTGDQRSIEPADWEVFRRTGVAHLVSISGLHITMFAWLAVWLLGRAWRCSTRLCLWWPAPHAGVWAGVALAAAYAVFSGWGLPAQRTVGMLVVVALLRTGGVQWPWYAVWSVVLAVMALWDPWGLWQAGFWLSFVAVGALLASGFDPARHAASSGFARWLTPVQRLLREQGVVVLTLSPLTLLFFGQVSVVGGVANLLAIPWVTLLVTPLALLGVVWAPLWDVAAGAVLWMTQLLAVMAAWPWASIAMAQPPWWAVALAIAAGVCLALRVPWPCKLLVLPWLLPALWWQSPRPVHGALQVLALDVGQGSAVLLRTATHSLLFDAGPAWPGGDAGERVVQPLLQALGESLNAVVLSHGDSDHIGGAEAVLAAHPQAALWGAGAVHVAQRLGRPWQPCVAGTAWHWDGVLWQVLHPPPYTVGERNAASCVLRVQAANGAAVLLTGDIEAAQERALLAAHASAGASAGGPPPTHPLRANLLIAPHHGSQTSSTAAFIAAVSPQVVLAQTGYRNRFGHPAARVVQRYADHGVQLLHSPQCGALHWHSDAPSQAQCERHLRARYWDFAPSK